MFQYSRSAALALRLSLGLATAGVAQAAGNAAPDEATRKLAYDMFKQLIEINTTDSVGSTTVAAKAMQQRLLDAGFPKEDIVVVGPNERKGNLVVRYHGRAGKTHPADLPS